MIALADYIITRFKQAGVKQVFGVPGDYQLELLDYFERDPEIEWVGNANELGAVSWGQAGLTVGICGGRLCTRQGRHGGVRDDFWCRRAECSGRDWRCGRRASPRGASRRLS